MQKNRIWRIFNKIKEFFRSSAERPSAEINSPADFKLSGEVGQNETQKIRESRAADVCPYCLSTDFVKRGTRKNKNQIVQLYLCRNFGCGRTFTAQDVKGKHFPLHIIIESMSYYNLGFTLEDTCRIIQKKFGRPSAEVNSSADVKLSQGGFVAPTPSTISDWINEYKELCRYERLRPFAIKMFGPMETIEVVTMAHRQLYRFRYHRAKTILMLEEFKNRVLSPLKDYLDNVSSETPHQYFQDGERMSEIRSKFDKADMIVKSKFNYANRLTAFVLQSIPDNKQRHEELQRFMIANDSCTVATEVPVYIRREDVEHMENQLKFKITNTEPTLGENRVLSTPSEFSAQETSPSVGGKFNTSPNSLGVVSSDTDSSSPSVGSQTLGENSTGTILLKGDKQPRQFPKLLTGHIDIVQIRNGSIYLLDYKPNASKEKPIEQLTWYAMSLSRLTGLRMFNFVCGWFDEKDYYQFYPLHVVKKVSRSSAGVAGSLEPSSRDSVPKRQRKRYIYFRDGIKAEIPKENELTIIPRLTKQS